MNSSTEYKIQADKNNSHMPPAYQEEKHKQINNSIKQNKQMSDFKGIIQQIRNWVSKFRKPILRGYYLDPPGIRGL